MSDQTHDRTQDQAGTPASHDASSAKGWVVVAWAPDEFGAVALAHGVFEARDRGRGVLVVNATKGDALVDDRYAGPEALQQVERELAAAGVPFEVRQSVGGDVADQVLQVTSEVDARLVVIGLRRRTPVGKLLMGSVDQRILLAATCPVLAVKPGEQPG
ncbi:universal stress protein [Nocardioides kribbensis]|uniref:universal stress protein n=1 Tax=Nocardioides kribbensis TaxID=305517 RepID=UPI0032DB81F6